MPAVKRTRSAGERVMNGKNVIKPEAKGQTEEEMRKLSIRDSLKSFFEPHLHPDNGEMLKVTKTEIDEKVDKILGIVESGDFEEDESKRVVVAELVKEFYKEYESLYSQYEDLTGEIRKKVHGKGDDESSSSSSSDSDSDKKSKRNGRVENDMDSVKKQIEAANLEIADLRRKLATTVEAKEAVESEHQETLKKLEESEEIFGNLRLETEKLATENKELNQRLDVAGETESDLKKERDGLEAELDKKSKDDESALEANNRLQAQKNETEAELEREKQEKAALLNQINDVQKALLEQEAAYNTLSQEHEQINGLFQEREATIKKLTDDYKQAREMLEEYMSKLEETERRMQETGKDVTSKESEIVDLEETMESLRNQVEMKGEEIESLMEKMNDIEVKLRLSSQKLRVTEQVLREKEEEMKSIEAKHLEKQALLEEKIAMTHETYRGLIKEISERVNSTIVTRFQTLSEKLEQTHGSYAETVVEATKMLLKAKKCLTEIKKEKEEMEKKLECKVREEGIEKEKLKETLLGLGEEKREAIRQLCVWIELHRDRCEYLEEVLSKMVAARGQRRSQRAWIWIVGEKVLVKLYQLGWPEMESRSTSGVVRRIRPLAGTFRYYPYTVRKGSGKEEMKEEVVRLGVELSLCVAESILLLSDDIRTMLWFCFRLWRGLISYRKPMLERLLLVIHHVYLRDIKPKNGVYKEGGSSVHWELIRTTWKDLADGVIVLHRLETVLRRKESSFDDRVLSSAVAKYKQQVLKKLQCKLRPSGFGRETIENIWKSLFDEEEATITTEVRSRILGDLFTPILGKPVHCEVVALPVSSPYILGKSFSMKDLEEEVVRLGVELSLYVAQSMFLLCDDIRTMLEFCFKLWRRVVCQSPVSERLLRVIHYVYSEGIKPKKGVCLDCGNSVHWELIKTTWEDFSDGIIILDRLDRVLRSKNRSSHDALLTSAIEKYKQQVLKNLEDKLRCAKAASEASGFVRETIQSTIFDLWKPLFDEEATCKVMMSRMDSDLFTPIFGKPLRSEIVALPVSSPYILGNDFETQELEEEAVRLGVELSLYLAESMFLLCDDVRSMLRFCYWLWRGTKMMAPARNESPAVGRLLRVMQYVYTKYIKPKKGAYQNDGNDSLVRTIRSTGNYFKHAFIALERLFYFLKVGTRCGRGHALFIEGGVKEVEQKLWCVKGVAEANGFARNVMESKFLEMWESLLDREPKESKLTLQAINKGLVKQRSLFRLHICFFELEKKSKDDESALEENNRLQAQKNETEAELEREAGESSKSIVRARSCLQHAEPRTRTEREATIKKLTDDYKQAREMLEEYMSKLEETERRMQETGKDVTSKESEIVDLEETMESLRNQVEMKEGEIESLMEKMNNLEVKLRLSSQKLRITEHKDGFGLLVRFV
ncbi:unnamed protein product, partial [Thlaspi arvense]